MQMSTSRGLPDCPFNVFSRESPNRGSMYALTLTNQMKLVLLCNLQVGFWMFFWHRDLVTVGEDYDYSPGAGCRHGRDRGWMKPMTTPSVGSLCSLSHFIDFIDCFMFE